MLFFLFFFLEGAGGMPQVSSANKNSSGVNLQPNGRLSKQEKWLYSLFQTKYLWSSAVSAEFVERLMWTTCEDTPWCEKHNFAFCLQTQIAIFASRSKLPQHLRSWDKVWGLFLFSDFGVFHPFLWTLLTPSVQSGHFEPESLKIPIKLAGKGMWKISARLWGRDW